MALNKHKRTKHSLIALSILMGICNASYAQIYKWVDENGKIHYSDKPLNSESKTIEIKDNLSQTQVSEARARAQKLIELQNRLVNQRLESDEEAKQELEKKEQKEKTLKIACAQAKNQLRILEMQAPVFSTDEKGERVFLSDKERQTEKDKINEAIATHCE